METEKIFRVNEQCEPDRIIEELSAGPQPGDIIESPFEADSNIDEEKNLPEAQEKGSTLALYEAWSVTNIKGCDDVTIYWFCSDYGRREQYNDLIADYGDKKDKDPFYDPETYCDELFSQEEIAQLANYLKGYDMSLITKRIATPINEPGYMTMRGNPSRGCTDFAYLHKFPGYNLPFTVCGEYQTYTCPPSVDISSKTMSRLIQFTGELFNSMGLHVPEDELQITLKELYDDHGLCATNGFTDKDGKSEWIERSQGPRQRDAEKTFVKVLFKRFGVEMPEDVQKTVDSISRNTDIYIVRYNNLIERIKNRQKFMEDLEKEDDLEIVDATRGGAIDGDV